MPLLMAAASLPVQAQIIAETHSYTGLNRAIPDGNAAGLSDVRTVTSAITNLSSLRLKLHVDGQFNGDLYGYLRHEGPNATNLCVLLNRVGRTLANPAGYADAGLDVTFDDSAPDGDIHQYHDLTNPPLGSPLTGTWQPDGRRVDPDAVLDTTARTTTLSSFGGDDASGQWTLFLADLDTGGTNQLVSWELQFINRVTISGTVRYYPTTYPPSEPSVKRVGSATIKLTGDTNLSVLTLGDGSYGLAAIAGGGTYGVAPGKTNDTPTANGVDSFDQFLIQRHILGRTLFDSPYKRLAADVDGAGNIDSFDQFLIQRLILGRASQFPLGLWRFVPADYVFPNTNSPWTAPTNRWHTGLVTDASGQDFVAIKLGDVDNSWMAPSGGTSLAPESTVAERSAPANLAPAVEFRVESFVAASLERVKVGVSVTGFSQVASAQFTLAWDPGVLRYVGMEDCGLRGGSFGTALVESGKLIFAWYDPEAVEQTMADGTTIFRANFQVIGEAGSMTALELSDSPTERKVAVGMAVASFRAHHGGLRVLAPGEVQVRSATLRGGVFQVSVPTVTGQRYVLEFTDSLPGTNWVALPSVDGNGAIMDLVDPAATNHQRFYRVRIE